MKSQIKFYLETIKMLTCLVYLKKVQRSDLLMRYIGSAVRRDCAAACGMNKLYE